MQISERTKIIKKLDSLVSKIVRANESRCATCGKKLLYKQRQAGHYIPREVLSTRWNLKNVHCQCAKCNVELGGNIKKYREWMCKNIPAEDLKYIEAEYDKYKNGNPSIISLEDMREIMELLKTNVVE